MKILYISEIVGRCGLQTIIHCLPLAKKLYTPDYIIANANSLTGAGGIGRQHAGVLRKHGVNCVTLGANAFLHVDIFEDSPLGYCLRPLNLEEGTLGSGVKLFQPRPKDKNASPENPSACPASTETRTTASASTNAQDSAIAGESENRSKNSENLALVVVVLAGHFAQRRIIPESPYSYIDKVCARFSGLPIFLDYFSYSTAEKQTLGYYLDGKVSAVVGSGAKVATVDERILRNGTGFITDAGRTGSSLSSGGYMFENKIREFKTGLVEYSACALENPVLQGVYIELDNKFFTTKIERVSIKDENSGSDY